MRKEDEKFSGAMRIFEALSSVDEELLERSEEQEKVVPFWRYTKVMAACASFVVLGIVTFVGTQMNATNNSSSDCAAPEMAQVMDDAGDTEFAYEAESAKDIMGEDGAVEEMEAVEEEAAAEEAPAEQEARQTSKTEIGSDEETDKLEAWTKLDEDSLRATEVLGAYVPTEIPAGYIFEEGNKYDAPGEAESIILTWSNGLDYISIDIDEYIPEEELKARLVDISKPETYDVHLYEIPYASSVPDEVRTTFDMPIFKESDLSLEIVKARMKSVDEQGDTNSPRGNFAVLYDSGVVVSFTGRGDAWTILNMFESITAE